MAVLFVRWGTVVRKHGQHDLKVVVKAKKTGTTDNGMVIGGASGSFWSAVTDYALDQARYAGRSKDLWQYEDVAIDDQVWEVIGHISDLGNRPVPAGNRPWWDGDD